MGTTNSEATFETGEHIFLEGDLLTRAYVLKSGKVELSKGVGENEQAVVCIVTQGGIVGEMALVDGKPAEISARVMEPVTALVINKDAFNQLADQTNPMVSLVLEALAQRLRQHTQDIALNKTIVR